MAPNSSGIGRFPGPGGMAGRERFNEQILEFRCIFFASPAFFVADAGFLIKVALAGNIGILQGIRPTA